MEFKDTNYDSVNSIEIFSRLRKYDLDCRTIERLVYRVLSHLKLTRFALSISFVTLGRIRKLNREYRKVDSATDVLAFPLHTWEYPAQLSGGLRPHSLGDVVVCPDRASVNARHLGQALGREVSFLLVHAILHLCGYDHQDPQDEEVMCEEQKGIMVSLSQDLPLEGCIKHRKARDVVAGTSAGTDIREV